MGKRFSDKGGNEKKAFLVLSKRGGKERQYRVDTYLGTSAYQALLAAPSHGAILVDLESSC